MAVTVRRRSPGESVWVGLIFLFPAAVFLLAIVFYPMIYTLIRSFFHDGPSGQATGFAGLSNYISIFTSSDSLKAFENNILWVIIVPAVVTVLGLFFAVLTERIRWRSAFKIVLFMPMAISFLASGVTWSLIYVDNPSQGLANAVATGIHDTFHPQQTYPELHPSGTATALKGNASQGYTSTKAYPVPSQALLPLTGLDLTSPPPNAHAAVAPAPGRGLNGVVWNDFKLGGGGKPGVINPGELGIPQLTVEAVRNGSVQATTKTADDGSFSFADLPSGNYQLVLPAGDFAPAYDGISWLGKDLITPSIMVAYLWIYAGFAMVLLAAGMSQLPRDTLEAARIDGASEWQVFRRITVPLLSPVLLVVFVTMLINVLKIFDIVFIMQQAAGGNARYANVLAVQLYTDYGNQQFGAASAIGIVLVLLVIPAMIFQIRRFRRDER
ncbi:ABC transporter permease [Microlunatus elymi]|uniref:ABC transporter permease n=1 Tax=Microlunatus elymi TaxID=2596828 RepID=UPI001AEFBA11|nr:ABC transporter permease subunit [Microlunatus elymi]